MPTIPPLFDLASTLNELFAKFADDNREVIFSKLRRKFLAQDKLIYSRGDEPEGIYQIVSGSVRICGLANNGTEAVLDFYGPGVWFGEVSALDGLPRTHDARANEATEVLHLDLAQLEVLLLHPKVSRALLKVQALRTRIVLAALELYHTRSVEKLLANRLLMLAVNHGVVVSRGKKIDLHLTQETLSQLVGTTHQCVEDFLQAWEKDGLLVYECGKFILLNKLGMEALAQ